MIIGIILAAAIAQGHYLCDGGLGPPVWCDTRKTATSEELAGRCLSYSDKGYTVADCGAGEVVAKPPDVWTTGLGATTSTQSVISAGYECGRHVINGGYYWQGRRVSAARWYEHIGRWYAGGLREDCGGLQ